MKVLVYCAAVVAVVEMGCATVKNGPHSKAAQELAISLPGLGSHSRAIGAATPEAQAYFDQGLSLLFAFNHDEAILSFSRAAELDPKNPMPWWGIAIANGPHINNPVVAPANARAAWAALQRAQALAGSASRVDQALIRALERRYAQPQPEDRKPLDEAYAAAMRSVWQAHRTDADVGALTAEALMDLRPWDLWQEGGAPQPGTTEIVATLEEVMEKSPQHPLALHLYIHAVEASARPERADVAADQLRELTPGLGHLVHMPSHIDVRRGRWVEAIAANEKALDADARYQALRPRQGFYNLYMAHNHHMLAYAAMMAAQSGKALAAIDSMFDRIPAEWLKENAAIADGFVAMPLEVRMRFGKWDEILARPAPDEHFPLARALWRMSRGVAFAAKGDAVSARAEHRAFLEAKAGVPKDASFGLNSAADLLAVGEALLEGEVLYREGKVAEGVASLRRATEREDRLRYDEPPDWIQPVRHALGATLLQEQRGVEAEEVFREDLRRLPGNGWALFGLARSLRMQGKELEAGAVEAQVAKAWAGADVKTNSACYCQPGR